MSTQEGTRCDGFTRTGEYNMGGPVMERCERAAEYACTSPMSSGYQLLCRYHKAAFNRHYYYARHGIVVPISAYAEQREKASR